MAVPAQSSLFIHFGEFKLDLRTGELRRNGDKSYLQDKPFQILALLLERPGQLVTRDELMKRLWASDTFVDFDQSLNKAVNRLREALEDSAEQPRYIETLPRRGYRFIAAIATVDGASSPAHPQNPDPAIASTFARLLPPWPLPAKVAAGAGILVVVAFAIWISVGRSLHAPASAASIHSLAVLPLENLTGDPAQDYFADGMTDELITDLGQIGSLRVISRTSIMLFKGVHKPLPQIARELNVDAVVEGTVMRSGERVRITAQLIYAPTDEHLWAQSYEGDVRDVLGLQNQVAGSIARQIRIQLTPQQQAVLKGTRVVNPEAYDAYLEAISQKGTIDGLQKSIAYFQQAIEKQPDYAEAHAGMGDAYMMLGHMVALPPQEAFPKAKSEALLALELDDSLADAHALLATVKFLYDWDFPGAEKEFLRAIVLNPNSIDAHGLYADFLSAVGRPAEAIAERRRNQERDPLSLGAVDGLAAELYWAGRYDEVIEVTRKVVAVDPNSWGGRLYLGLALEQKHQFPEAIEELQKAVEVSNDATWIAFVAHAKALSGDKDGARKILANLEQLSHRTYVSPYLFAIVYPDLGNKDKAFFWLEKCYQGREHDLVFSRVWPMFNSLHADPRYNDLMRRVGLPK
jgi:TolB-like protein/DNA-binding winged helix-turn-helix (wHTH) protein